jgi:hypothetical protein
VVNTLDRLKLPPAGPLAAAHADYFTGFYTHDPEPWAYQEHIFEALLERLSRHHRIVLVPGDVHYSCCLKLDYWRYDPTQPQAPPVHARFIQVTGSAFKNETTREKIMLFQSGFVAKLAQRLGTPRVRLGYKTLGKEPPLVPPADKTFNRHVERQNHANPALIPLAALPEGTRQRYPPDWVWRMEMLRDTREDEARLKGVADVPAFPDAGATGNAFGNDVAARHFWQTVHVPSRIVTFFSSGDQVRMESQDGRPEALIFGIRHALRGSAGEKIKDYTRYRIALHDENLEPPALPTVA